MITVKRAYLELERDGVIVTRQGKGSFVADSAGLSAKLHSQELDAHLSAAANIGRMLGLSSRRPGGAPAAHGRGSERRKAMTEPVIALAGVEKSYRFFKLTDLSLRLDAGQIMGLVGANGAGKSTTIRMLMGLVRQDRGDIRVLGHAMPRDQAAAKRDDRLRLRRHAPAHQRDAGVAHALRRVGLSRLGRVLRRAAGAPLHAAPRISRSRRCRTANASRPRCCSRSPIARACCCSTSRPPGSIPSRVTRCSPS